MKSSRITDSILPFIPTRAPCIIHTNHPLTASSKAILDGGLATELALATCASDSSGRRW